MNRGSFFVYDNSIGFLSGWDLSTRISTGPMAMKTGCRSNTEAGVHTRHGAVRAVTTWEMHAGARTAPQ